MSSFSIGRAVVSVAASGDNALGIVDLTNFPNKKIRVINGLLVAAAPVVLTFKSGLAGAASNLSGAMSLIAGTPIHWGVPQSEWEGALILTKKGEDLNLSLGAAVQLSGLITYMRTD